MYKYAHICINFKTLMKKRLLFYEINKYISHKNSLIITGMRQVGKTTLMKQVYDSINSKNKLWFDFDNPLDQKVFESIDFNNIYLNLEQMVKDKNKKIYVFIDEIQNYPMITKVIKYLLDYYSVKFIVTGSSNFYLKNLFPESLSGRKFLYYLPPLRFKEYLYFKDKLSLKEVMGSTLSSALKQISIFKFKKYELDYDNYLKYGGFPEVVTTENKQTKKEILKNIITSFFEKDLKILSDHKDVRELRDLMLLLVPRVGSMLDISKIASELGIRRMKIYQYLEFLQGAFMIKLLPKYSKSIDRSIAGGKKVYFSDTGLLNTIGNVNDPQLLENAVVNQLSYYGDLSFYNKRNTAEIDIILDKQIAFEVKLKGVESEYIRLKKLTFTLGLKKYYLISKTYINKRGYISASNL